MFRVPGARDGIVGLLWREECHRHLFEPARLHEIRELRFDFVQVREQALCLRVVIEVIDPAERRSVRVGVADHNRSRGGLRIIGIGDRAQIRCGIGDRVTLHRRERAGAEHLNAGGKGLGGHGAVRC